MPRADTPALVLAGGQGTRLRDLVPDLPKPMAPVQGRPFLAWLLDYWIAQGVRRFVLLLGYRREAIEAHFGGGYRGAALEYAAETVPLGTGGALLQAARQLSGTQAFLLLNGDTYFEAELASLREFHRKSGAQWTFALSRRSAAAGGLGVRLAQDGRVSALEGDLLNGGVCMVEPALVAGWQLHTRRPLSIDDDLLPEALADGAPLYGLECAGRFVDIGTPENYRRAQQRLGGRADAGA